MNKGKELAPLSCTLILFTLSLTFLFCLHDTILAFGFSYLSTVDIRKSVKAFLQSCKGRQHRLTGVVSLCVVYIHHLLFKERSSSVKWEGQGKDETPRGGRCSIFVRRAG